MRIFSLDVENMYTTIPKRDTTKFVYNANSDDTKLCPIRSAAPISVLAEIYVTYGT
jgi:hypothetical protein